MQKYYELQVVLEYIESHLKEDISADEVAKATFISLSLLQKIFKQTFNYGVKEYIVKRRIALAAQEFVTTKATVLEIALNYGYSTCESFGRTFKKVYGCLPSDFRKSGKFGDAFSSIILDEGGMARSIPELLNRMKAEEGNYIVCFDIVGLKEINGISRHAGDIALSETIQRILENITEEMYLVRIGGDEFAVLTPYDNITKAEQLALSIADLNGKKIHYNGIEIPLYLRYWYGKAENQATEYSKIKTLHDNVKFYGKVDLNDKKE